MKRIITLLLCFNIVTVFSQDVKTFDILFPLDMPSEHYGTCSYHALGLSDGNFVFTQSYYTSDANGANSKDIGVTFVKMSSKAKLIDTLFYEFKDSNSVDYPNNKLIRNPYNENENIYTYFSYGDTCYYNAVFFDNDLNITDEVRKPFLAEGFGQGHLSGLNKDNNFLYFWGVSAAEHWAMEADIYGEVKKRSPKLLAGDDYGGYCNYFSFFTYDEENKQYGFAIDEQEDGGMGYELYIILDEDLNVADKKTLSGYDGYQYDGTGGYSNVVELYDGNFAIMGVFMNGPSADALKLCKVDKDFNIVEENILRYENNSPSNYLNTCVEWRNLLKCKDGGLYCIWSQTYENVFGERDMYVARVDKDFNLLWERCVKTGLYITGSHTGASVLENGDLVLTGNIFTSAYGGVEKGTSVIILHDNGTSVSENIYDIRPYSFYPNPVRDKINIRFSPDVNCKKIDVYSMDGRLCHTQNFNMQTINIDNLNSGIYVMNITLDNGTTYTDRIVVY